MKLAGLSCTLLLSLSVCAACTHTRSVAHPQQEERAAQKAENEEGDSPGGSKGDDADGAGKGDEDEGEKKADERGAQTGSAGATRADGEGDGSDDGKKGEAKKAEDVEPEDIDVATSPQGLLEPGAMDKVRDKLGVAKGESVQAALRRFQREQGLPATGMLDQETVERLGLSPDEIFEQAER